GRRHRAGREPGSAGRRRQRRQSRFGDRRVENTFLPEALHEAGRGSEDSRAAVGADAVDEHTGIELHRLPERGVHRLGEAESCRADRRRLRTLISYQHRQNGPSRASGCPPSNVRIGRWVNRWTAGPYSPDQLLSMIVEKSAKSARLAAATAALISASISASTLFSSTGSSALAS